MNTQNFLTDLISLNQKYPEVEELRDFANKMIYKYPNAFGEFPKGLVNNKTIDFDSYQEEVKEKVNKKDFNAIQNKLNYIKSCLLIGERNFSAQINSILS